MRKQIRSSSAPLPVGVYSPAIAADGPFVFVSGQGPLDPATGKIQGDDFRSQAELTFKNVGALLEAAGTSWANAVKVNVYLADLKDFPAMNEIYRKFVKEPYPARTTVQAGLLGILIEVDAIATIPG